MPLARFARCIASTHHHTHKHNNVAIHILLYSITLILIHAIFRCDDVRAWYFVFVIFIKLLNRLGTKLSSSTIPRYRNRNDDMSKYIYWNSCHSTVFFCFCFVHSVEIRRLDLIAFIPIIPSKQNQRKTFQRARTHTHSHTDTVCCALVYGRRIMVSAFRTSDETNWMTYERMIDVRFSGMPWSTGERMTIQASWK